MRRGQRITLGVIAIVVGLILVLRPFLTLAVLLGLAALLLVTAAYALVGPDPGGGAVAARMHAALPRWLRGSRPAQIGLGLTSAVLAVLAVARPRITYVVFSYLLLLLLAGYGAYLLVRSISSARAREGSSPHRRGFILGPAAILAAVAGWGWPDVTLMLLAAAAGLSLVYIGARLLRGRRREAGNVRAGIAVPGGSGWRRLGMAAALPAAMVLLIVSGYLNAPATPEGFYTASENTVPDNTAPDNSSLGHGAGGDSGEGPPGVLLRAEEIAAPAGARARRILYTTTRDAAGTPALASAVVYAPSDVVDAPVIAWARGTTGFANGCAPSIVGQEAGALLVLGDLLAAGWAVVAADYTGLGTGGAHPYLIGEGEGRSVIDAVRAAAATDLPLGEETVLWGHSQGGHAALWAGSIWPQYAPELPLLGVVALAPAANLPAIVDAWGSSSLTNVFSSYVIAAYSQEYDDVDSRAYIRPGARATAEAYAARCLSDPRTAVTLAASLLQERTIWSSPPTGGALGERLEENIPTRQIEVPVLIGQGEADAAIPPATQDAFVRDRCSQGWGIDYRRYPGLDHMPLVEPGSPAIADALAWTAAVVGAGAPEGAC